jgi:hypothetical protein
MATTTIDQPATASTGTRARPARALTFGKLVVLVVSIGVGTALVVAGVIGVGVLLLDSAGG